MEDLTTQWTRNRLDAFHSALRWFLCFGRLFLVAFARARFGSQENLSLVDNPVVSDRTEDMGTDVGDTIANGMQLSFTTGESSGREISFIEADLDNTSGDIDLFGFLVPRPAEMMANVFGERLALGSLEFDPVLGLLNMNGDVIFSSDDVFFSGDLFGGTTHQEDDPFLNNISLVAGDYFLSVSAATTDISDDPNVGDNYWLVTSLNISAVPEPSSFLADQWHEHFGQLVGRRPQFVSQNLEAAAERRITTGGNDWDN